MGQDPALQGLLDTEFPGGVPQNAGKKTFAGEGRGPESRWMDTAGGWTTWMWQMPPHPPQRLEEVGTLALSSLPW